MKLSVVKSKKAGNKNPVSVGEEAGCKRRYRQMGRTLQCTAAVNERNRQMLYDEKQLYKEGFNQNQVEEIIDGQMAGIDVSAYANKNFLAVQMRQVRMGLVDGLDVTEYAHDFYDWFQMEEIRKGLMANVDVEKYAMPSVTSDQMHEMREALEEGIDLSPHIKRDAKVLRLLRDAIRGGYDLLPFVDGGYRAEELEQIGDALGKGLDIGSYIAPGMCAYAIREIARGLLEDLDVCIYSDERLDWRQMRELRLGLLHRVDAKLYRDHLYSWKQMRELRLGLEDGLDIGRYRFFYYTDAQMCEMREKMLREQPASEEPDGRYEYFFDTRVQKEGAILADGTIDYTDVHWFDVVEEGQTLAVYHDAGRADGPGRRSGREQSILTGKGIAQSRDQRTYTAAISGKAELTESGLSVKKLLVIDNLTLLDVKVVFDGTVYVRGRVESGTTIRAADEIIVDGLVENAVLTAGTNILLRGGARGTEKIKAGGNVAAAFLESAHVQALGSIQANDSRDSELFAGGRIHLFGTAAGGMIKAQRGIHVGSAGDESRKETVLTCDLLKSKKELGISLEEQRLSVSREIEMLTNALADFDQAYTPEKRNHMELYVKIENAIYIKKKQLQDIIGRRTEIWRLRENVNQSKIVVDNRVYPGVSVSIGGSLWSGEVSNEGAVVFVKKGSEVLAESGKKGTE